jgi:hypothetical protein
MLSPPPMDSITVEKRLKSPDAPVALARVATIDAADTNAFLPGERLQQDEARARLHRRERQTDVPPYARSLPSEVKVRSFALAFVGLLCATVIGFVSEIRPLKPDSADYGYDEALGTETSFLSSANLPSNCPGGRPTTSRASNDGLDARGVSAIAAHGAAPPTADFTSRE